MIILNRSRAYYREQRIRAINRKKGILKRLGGDDLVQAWSGGGVFGRFAKGKIHCSCWMCRTKSYDEKKHNDRKKEQFEWKGGLSW
jgi:hypothetical protein